MSHVISVIQTKGGTGKTTTSMMVAFALTALGRKVLVLDSDKQRSATDWAEDVEDQIEFEVRSVPTTQQLGQAISRYRSPDYGYDFLIVDTPPGSNSLVESASQAADLVLVPTGVSPLDMRRTQATLDALDGTGIPVAVVLVNVDKRERLLDLAQETLTANTRAAVADTIIPTRSATRKAGSTAPRIETKQYSEWMELAEELLAAF